MRTAKTNQILPLMVTVDGKIINSVFQSKYHVTNEQMLIEQTQIEAAKQDSSFFGAIYQRYYKQIFMYVNSRMEDKDNAFDITAQVFLKALTNLQKYEFKGVPFASWLYRIAQSEVYQSFRDKKSEKIVNVDVSDIRTLFEEIEEEHYEEFKPKMLKLINALPEKDLKLVNLRFFEKKSFKEIADELAITENNAKVRLYRILEKLKKSLLKNTK